LLGLVGPTGGGQAITQIESMLNDVVRAELDALFQALAASGVRTALKAAAGS
jgi:hypothetical protein